MRKVMNNTLDFFKNSMATIGAVGQEFLSKISGCWNGNISTVKWRLGGDSFYLGYNLKYDDCNRLHNAVFGAGDDLRNYILLQRVYGLRLQRQRHPSAARRAHE